MKKIIRLTESDLTRIVKRVVNESMGLSDDAITYKILKQSGIDKVTVHVMKTPPETHGDYITKKDENYAQVFLGKKGMSIEITLPEEDIEKIQDIEIKIKDNISGIENSEIEGPINKGDKFEYELNFSGYFNR